jgi:hypothetical protein
MYIETDFVSSAAEVAESCSHSDRNGSLSDRDSSLSDRDSSLSDHDSSLSDRDWGRGREDVVVIRSAVSRPIAGARPTEDLRAFPIDRLFFILR